MHQYGSESRLCPSPIDREALLSELNSKCRKAEWTALDINEKYVYISLRKNSVPRLKRDLDQEVTKLEDPPQLPTSDETHENKNASGQKPAGSTSDGTHKNDNTSG